jgi:hypothetical protein
VVNGNWLKVKEKKARVRYARSHLEDGDSQTKPPPLPLHFLRNSFTAERKTIPGFQPSVFITKVHAMASSLRISASCISQHC